MSEELQNYINKINEMQNTIEWQKKAIAERDAEIEGLQQQDCFGCKWINDNSVLGCGHRLPCQRVGLDFYEKHSF
jgi:hypothetical protein